MGYMPTLFFVGGIMISPPLDEIRHLVQEIAESEKLELVDVEFKAGKSRSLLRIYIDKQGGVTLADCENVSRQLSVLLDVKDLMKNAYILEVSSPGIDRYFQTDRDYFRSIGKNVKLHVSTGHVTGKLMEINDEQITIERDGSLQSIPRTEVLRAQQEIGLAAQPRKEHKKRK